MPSIWEQQSFTNPTDYTIIGAGFTGLYTALELRQKFPAASIRILERGTRPIGASVRNAGFACFGSPSEILDDAEDEDLDSVVSRVLRRYEGLQRIRGILGEAKSGWQQHGGFEVFTKNDSGVQLHCIEKLDFLNETLSSQLGFKPFAVHQHDFGMNVSGPLIRIEGEASLNTGSMMKELLLLVQEKSIDLHFGSDVSGISRTTDLIEISTSGGITYRSERVILATNAFTRRIYDLPVWPNRGQVLLTEPIPGLKLQGNYHLNQGYFYFRDFEGGILLGGGRHLDREAEQTDSSDITDSIQQGLDRLLSEVILPHQEFKVKLRWAGTMGFGRDNEKEPILRELEPGVFAAVRLGGMGVAMAPMLARDLVALM